MNNDMSFTVKSHKGEKCHHFNCTNPSDFKIDLTCATCSGVNYYCANCLRGGLTYSKVGPLSFSLWHEGVMTR